MERYAFRLGSHPDLSAIEIACFCERVAHRCLFDLGLLPDWLLLSTPRPLDAPRVMRGLGGTPTIVRLHGDSSSLDPRAIRDVLPSLATLPATRPRIGVSYHAGSAPPKETTRTVRMLGMALKRSAKKKGLRLLSPRHGTELTSAQLFHGGFPASGVAVQIIAASPGRYHIGTVEAVQDIRAYARRDRARPGADPGRGMIPPKVAQMLVNLSLAPPGGTLYDPLSGTGTIPMEALLMELAVSASDSSQKQVERTKENLAWITRERFTDDTAARSWSVFRHDIARSSPPLPPASLDAVVTEGWLGPARTSPPSPREAGEVFTRVHHMITAMLAHVLPSLRREARVVLAVPAFRVGRRILHAPFLRARGGFPPPPWAMDNPVPRGWDHPIFRAARRGTLLYGRPDAIVLREIMRLRRFSPAPMPPHRRELNAVIARSPQRAWPRQGGASSSRLRRDSSQ